MKENVLDVLMYLFENYMDEEKDFIVDQDSLKTELSEAGFPGPEIEKAFRWLKELETQPGSLQPCVSPSLRVFCSQEIKRLDVECRGFLMFMEQIGILDSVNRELVIDRIMALETEEIDLEQVKWVVLMVLFSQPGQEAAYAWMENLLFQEYDGMLH